MTAKITLIGQPQSLRIEKDIVTFRIITGPASNTAPKGLTLFKATTYVVQCAMRHDLRSKSNRGRASERDKSEALYTASSSKATRSRAHLHLPQVQVSARMANPISPSLPCR